MRTFARFATSRRSRNAAVALTLLVLVTGADAAAPTGWSGYAGNAQHTAIAPAAAQSLDRIRWQTPVDLAPQYNGTFLLIHYGSPVITGGNTVVVPVKVGATEGFRVEGRAGADGTLWWTQSTDYLLPPHSWTPSFAPVLTRRGLSLPGIGGTVYTRTRVDRPEKSRVKQRVFYGAKARALDPAAYDTSVFINTPLTSDRHSTMFFGFQVTGATPLALQSGIARLTNGGRGRWVTASTAAGDPTITKVAHNSAPALSADGSILYVAVNDGDGWGGGRGYLLALDSRTLATLASVRLKDPASGQDASVNDNGTASPTIGPDGHVYFGVLEGASAHHSRGWLLHFDRLLNPVGEVGAFGWDDTASIVPATMVPGYTGTSPYLVMTKYNDYAQAGGDGVNRIAVLDPNDSMPDPISGIPVMNEVLTVVGPTPDPQFFPAHPNAVREWCINTAAVDPVTRAVFANNEDGKLYRWDMVTGTLAQTITLTSGLGEAYTPTIVGPDGTVYAINNAILFAVGE